MSSAGGESSAPGPDSPQKAAGLARRSGSRKEGRREQKNARNMVVSNSPAGGGSKGGCDPPPPVAQVDLKIEVFAPVKEESGSSGCQNVEEQSRNLLDKIFNIYTGEEILKRMDPMVFL